MKRYAPALFVIGVLIAAWLWWPTAERAVRARISELVETMSPRPGESDLERLARLSRPGSALAPTSRSSSTTNGESRDVRP